MPRLNSILMLQLKLYIIQLPQAGCDSCLSAVFVSGQFVKSYCEDKLTLYNYSAYVKS